MDGWIIAVHDIFIVKKYRLVTIMNFFGLCLSLATSEKLNHSYTEHMVRCRNKDGKLLLLCLKNLKLNATFPNFDHFFTNETFPEAVLANHSVDFSEEN